MEWDEGIELGIPGFSWIFGMVSVVIWDLERSILPCPDLCPTSDAKCGRWKSPNSGNLGSNPSGEKKKKGAFPLGKFHPCRSVE